MGYPDYSMNAGRHIADSYKGKSTDAVFTRNVTKDVDPLMSPFGLKFREARDSTNHPESLAIIVALDVTGSMGSIIETIVREGLPPLMETLIKHGVKDASVLFMAITDHTSGNEAPLQIGQFESGEVELNKWLTSTWIEGGGGGTNQESYLLTYHVASRLTSIDCFEKRGQKGFLITIGDEASWDRISASALEKIFGSGQYSEETDKQLLEEAKGKYNVYHIHCNQAAHRDDKGVIGYWKDLLGQNFIKLEDHKVVAEVIASTVAVQMGADLHDVTKDFDKSTALAVKGALANIGGGLKKKGKEDEGGIANL